MKRGGDGGMERGRGKELSGTRKEVIMFFFFYTDGF